LAQVSHVAAHLGKGVLAMVAPLGRRSLFPQAQQEWETSSACVAAVLQFFWRESRLSLSEHHQPQPFAALLGEAILPCLDSASSRDFSLVVHCRGRRAPDGIMSREDLHAAICHAGLLSGVANGVPTPEEGRVEIGMEYCKHTHSLQCTVLGASFPGVTEGEVLVRLGLVEKAEATADGPPVFPPLLVLGSSAWQNIARGVVKFGTLGTEFHHGVPSVARMVEMRQCGLIYDVPIGLPQPKPLQPLRLGMVHTPQQISALPPVPRCTEALLTVDHPRSGRHTGDLARCWQNKQQVHDVQKRAAYLQGAARYYQ